MLPVCSLQRKKSALVTKTDRCLHRTNGTKLQNNNRTLITNADIVGWVESSYSLLLCLLLPFSFDKVGELTGASQTC